MGRFPWGGATEVAPPYRNFDRNYGETHCTRLNIKNFLVSKTVHFVRYFHFLKLCPRGADNGIQEVSGSIPLISTKES